MLEVDGLSKFFGGVQALTDVSFAVATGEIVGLIGPNGAGKTTCFNLINGLMPPSAGEIRLGSTAMMGLPPYRRARLGLARTFQNIQLFGGMTVLENVLTGVHLHQQVGVFAALLPLPSVTRAQAENRRLALELLELVGLGGKEDEPAEALAYGDQRRLEIARALAQQPQLLLMDEPAAGLNPRETEDLMALMEKLLPRGITLLVIEHDMTLVMGLCHRIVVLDHVVPVHPGRGEDAGGQFGPVAQVPAGVAHDDGVAGAAGGGVDAHHLPQGDRKHLVGVGPGQVVAGGEGQPGQVLQGLAILRQEAQLVELLLVEGDVLVDPGEGGLEPLQLHLSQLLPIHLLRILVEDCHGLRPRFWFLVFGF